MSALPLLDMYLARFPDAGSDRARSAERLRQVAERVVETALTRHAEIDRLDVCVETAPGGLGGADARAAVLIRALYSEWAREAEAILDRVTLAKRFGIGVVRGNELRDRAGRVQAMLCVTREDVEKGRQQIRDGRWHTIEEVRRELGLNSPRGRKAGPPPDND